MGLAKTTSSGYRFRMFVVQSTHSLLSVSEDALFQSAVVPFALSGAALPP